MTGTRYQEERAKCISKWRIEAVKRYVIAGFGYDD